MRRWRALPRIPALQVSRALAARCPFLAATQLPSRSMQQEANTEAFEKRAILFHYIFAMIKVHSRPRMLADLGCLVDGRFLTRGLMPIIGHPKRNPANVWTCLSESLACLGIRVGASQTWHGLAPGKSTLAPSASHRWMLLWPHFSRLWAGHWDPQSLRALAKLQ